MTTEDTDKIVAAIDRNTTAVKSVSDCILGAATIIWVPLIMIMGVIGCPPAKSSPITHAPIAETPMQYWHTQWVPTGEGVYPLEVYAPALPKVEPEPYMFVDIGDPPRLETPEPGTLHFVLATVAIFLCGFKCGFIAKACTCEKREIARKALEEDPHA